MEAAMLPEGMSQAGQASQESYQPKLVRSRKACLTCRGIKVRCPQPANPVTDTDPCERCTRLKIACEYDTDKRKRKRIRVEAVSSGSQSSSAHFTPNMQNLPLSQFSQPDNSYSRNSMHSGPSEPPAIYNLPVQQQPSSYSGQASSMPYNTNQQPVFNDKHYSPVPNMSGRMPTPSMTSPDSSGPSGPSGRPIRSAGDFATLVEAIEATSNGTTQRAQDTDPDPLSMSILNMAEAVSLVENFHVRLNAYVNMFDPTIVSASMLQQTSAVLFSTILSISAKFHRPDIYKLLLQHAKQLVTRRLLSARYDIQLLQSILLLAHWREVSDGSAFVDIGTAIRLGYQLELHTSHDPACRATGSLYDQLDRQRTWFQLLCYDTAYRLRTRNSLSPAMIPLSIFPKDASAWLRSESNASDRQLVFSVELTRVMRIIEGGLTGEAVSDVTQSYFLSLLDQFRLRWIDGDITWDVIREAKCRWAYWYNVFNFRTSTSTSQTFDRNMAGLLNAAENTVASALKIFSLQMIDYLPDSNAFQLLFLGERLSMLHEILQPEMKDTLLRWLQQIHNAADSTLGSGRRDSLPSYFIAKYYKILLREIQKPDSRQNTRPPSRAQSPVPMMPDFGNAADLSNNLAAWLNGTDFDVFGGAAQFETDYASLRQTFAQDVNWTDLLTNS